MRLSTDQLGFVTGLAQVVARLKGLGLILTSRTEVSQEFEWVQIQALSVEDFKSMLEHEAGAALPLECLDWIHARAADNPLFTLEFFGF
jgi:hypothetical protein